MSESARPPGPYRVCDMRHQKRGNLKILSEPSVGVQRDLGYVYASHPQADAIAALFIAAPDLLEALKRFDALVDFGGEIGTEEITIPTAAAKTLFPLALAALAKATTL